MAWDETCENMSPAGDGSLQLNEGEREGYFESGSQDLTDLCWQDIRCICKVQKDPAGTGPASYDIEINTSEDNVSWSGWEIFKAGEKYCRYINMRATVYGDPATGQRPKLVAFSAWGGPVDSVAWLPNVTSTLNNPPANPNVGDRHLIGTGAGAWLNKDGQIAECVESDDKTWRYTLPKTGQVFYHGTDGEHKRRAASSWETWDVWKVRPRQYCPGDSNQGEFPVLGTWAWNNDNAQCTAGYNDNSAGAANGDYVKWKVYLGVGNYQLWFMTMLSPNNGIVKAYLDTTLVATWDTYNVANVRNTLLVQSAISVSVAGIYELKAKVDGQNGASGGFEAYISYMELVPE